jgi:DNA-binding FadR family transcriptional regulator
MVSEGTLKPGDRLPAERDLAQQLGIGRPALREALRSLEAAGLLELRKGKSGGAFVSFGKPEVVSENVSDLLRLGSISVENLFEARSRIEDVIVRIACERAEEVDIRALEENVRAASRFAAQGEDEKRIQANIDFHTVLARATHNPVFQIVLHGIADAMRAVIARVGSEAPRKTFPARRRLVAALARRDVQDALAQMQLILSEARKMYERRSREAQRQPTRKRRTAVAIRLRPQEPMAA